MKNCPKCGQSFLDEYLYCLSDGTPLVAQASPPEELTVIRKPKREGMKTSTVLLFILAGVLTLALGATIGVLYVFWPRQTAVEQVQRNGASERPAANQRQSQPTVTPEPTVQPERTPTPKKEDSPPPQRPSPPAPTDAGDPGPTRISFRAGRVSETLTGTVSNFRTYLLYAKDGQTLTASVRSDDDCATFDGGSTRISYPTGSGDNPIPLVNNCDGQARFTLTVSIR